MTPPRLPQHFTITLTVEDHVAFLLFALRELPPGRRMRRNAWTLFVVVYLLYAASQWGDPAHGIALPGVFALHLLLAALVFGIAFYLLLWLVPPALLRAAVKMGPRRHSLATTSCHFHDGILEIQNPSGRGRIHISDVAGVGETPSHVFLWLGGFSAFIIPTRDIQTPQPKPEHK